MGAPWSNNKPDINYIPTQEINEGTLDRVAPMNLQEPEATASDYSSWRNSPAMGTSVSQAASTGAAPWELGVGVYNMTPEREISYLNTRVKILQDQIRDLETQNRLLQRLINGAMMGKAEW